MGVTWNEQFVDTSRLLSNSIVLGDSLNGWLFCGGGKIYKTSNGDRLTSVENEQSIKPTLYTLYQNYPNPFNAVTSINYQLQEDAHVKLIIYDVLGPEVAVLVDEHKSVGYYDVSFDASAFTSGVYFYKLTASSFTSVKNMLLAR